MIAKMKSLCGSESSPHFSRLAPSPRPNQPPSARAYRPWIGWRAAPNSLVSRPSQTSKRPSRLGLVTMKATAISTNGAPANPNQRSGMPAANSTPATIAPRIITVPRSWPEDHRADAHGGEGDEVGHEHVAERVRGPCAWPRGSGRPTAPAPA